MSRASSSSAFALRNQPGVTYHILEFVGGDFALVDALRDASARRLQNALRLRLAITSPPAASAAEAGAANEGVSLGAFVLWPC